MVNSICILFSKWQAKILIILGKMVDIEEGIGKGGDQMVENVVVVEMDGEEGVEEEVMAITMYSIIITTITIIWVMDGIRIAMYLLITLLNIILISIILINIRTPIITRIITPLEGILLRISMSPLIPRVRIQNMMV